MQKAACTARFFLDIFATAVLGAVLIRQAGEAVYVKGC